MRGSKIRHGFCVLEGAWRAIDELVAGTSPHLDLSDAVMRNQRPIPLNNRNLHAAIVMIISWCLIHVRAESTSSRQLTHA